MNDIKAFVQHREVGSYQKDYLIRFVLLIPFAILGIALSKTLSTVLYVLIAVILIIIYVVLNIRQNEDELYLNEALQGASIIIIFIIMGNALAHDMNFYIQFYLVCATCFVLVVLITILQIRRRIKKHRYRLESVNMQFDDFRIAVGGLAGITGYVAADLFVEQVRTSISIALLLAGTFLFLPKITESVMLHYYVKKYNLSSLIRVKHIQ